MHIRTEKRPRARVVLALVAAFSLGSLALIAIRAAHAEIQADFRPTRALARVPASGPLAKAELVEFRSESGDTLRGWWVPGSNDSAIVFVHGTGADRTALAPQAELLAKRGYAVLLFDMPGHGQSTGQVTWSQTEPNALCAALDYAQARGARHLGVVGFSAGAMIAVHQAAHEPRIEGLVLEGALENLDGAVRSDFRHWGPFSEWPAVWATRWAGYRPKQLAPIGRVRGKMLFIAGSLDEDVPLPLTRDLFESIQGDKELWVVEGATHGAYQHVAGAEFEARLVAFFARAFAER
ncbi:MAG TPA: alpha/beta fold hydrolase, partial [Polyangiaceae bacterium]|nr:alpha/beta fold hydrolase [Polyangiaceae bacterium]